MVWNYGMSLLVVTIVLFTLFASDYANAQLSGTISTVTGTVDNTISTVTNQVTSTVNNTVSTVTNPVTSTGTSLPTVNPTVGTIVNATGTTDVTTTSGSVSIGNPLGLPLPNITIPVSASSSVAGVTAFGNGTITSSVNGVQMSFWFDPQGPAAGQNSTTTNKVHLTVNAQDFSGNQIPGMFIELQNSKGSDVERGDTPVTFTATSGQKYIIYANNYKNVIFNHWDDGTTNPARHVTPTQSSSMTAFYSTGAATGVSQPPTGLMATAISSSQINLRWNAPTDNGGSQITGYKIERSLDNGATWSVLVANTASPGTTYSDTGLGPNTTYTYRISAINSSGSSLPSAPASVTTVPSGQTISTVQSGLVASDSLTNETKTQQQLAAEHGYWFYGGDAPAEHAPLSYSRDTSGLHIGVQAPANGTYAGFYATSPVHNAKLWHAKITNPVRATKNNFYENGMYVQTANGNVSYVTCTTLTNNQATVWAVVNATGNTTQITAFDVLYFDPSANQPLTRDCTIVTNGDNFLQVFFDGAQVYENQHGNLQMPAPFNAFLEPQTSDGSEFLTGSYQDYYVALDKNVSVTHLPSNAGTVNIVDNTGSVLASSPVSGGNATLDVSKFHLPLAAKIQVLDSSNNVVSSNPENIYGGDMYSVTVSNTSPPPPGIVLDNVQSTSGTTSSDIITLSNFNAGSGTDQLLIVGVSANSNNVASVTFGGVPLTMAVSSFVNNDAEFWYLKNPSGTGNIVVTTNGATHAVVGAYSLSGVDQTAPIPTHAARHNTNPNSPSISITTASPNDWVLDLPSMYGGSTLGTPTCTQGWDIDMSNQITGASSSLLVPTPGTVTCSWTANVGDVWDDVAVEVKAAGTTSAGASAPQPPTGLTATSTSSSQINLSWAAPSDNGGSAISGYKVERSADGGSTWTTVVPNTGSTSTVYSDMGLASSTSYAYRISAINAVGTSTPSNTASATTGMAVTHIVLNNVQSTSGTTSSDTITLSNFDIGPSSNQLLIVGVSANSNNVASVTFGGVPLTMTVSSFSNNDAEFWYLKNPSGTGNIVVTTNGATHAVVGAYSFSGVDQTVPIATHVSRHNTSPNSPSISITTASLNDWVLDLPSMYGGSTLGSSTCTQQWDVNIPNQITGTSSSLLVPTPGTVTCGWTANTGDLWDDVAVEINAAR